MKKITKEQDHYELNFRNKIGGGHVFSTEKEALDYAEERGYEPEEIKIRFVEGGYLYDSTLWDTEDQAIVIKEIVDTYIKAHPNEGMYAGEAFIIAKFLMASNNIDELTGRVKKAFDE